MSARDRDHELNGNVTAKRTAVGGRRSAVMDPRSRVGGHDDGVH